MIAAASQNFIRINTLNAATGIGTELAEHILSTHQRRSAYGQWRPGVVIVDAGDWPARATVDSVWALFYYFRFHSLERRNGS